MPRGVCIRVHLSTLARLAELEKSLLGILGAAVAAGLTAHLLSESVWHRGSLVDIALLIAAIGLLKWGGMRAMPRTGLVVAGVLGAAAIAMLWPLLEPGGHVGAESVVSLLWLIPVMLTFVCSIAIVTKESLHLVRAIVAVLVTRTRKCAETRCPVVNDRRIAPGTILTRLFSRRGPPPLVLTASFNT
jgi:hypothetical protein